MSPATRNRLLALTAGLVLALSLWISLPDSGTPPLAFTAREVAGTTVVAEPGAGFYGVERSPDHRWSWSGGEAVLLLRRTSGGTEPLPLQLHFYLQSIVPRTVTVRFREFILWRGRLDRRRVPVDIPLFTLTGPGAEITISSDLPGELKPGGGDPRLLAFALYDLELNAAE
jgi:hypothetical protein